MNSYSLSIFLLICIITLQAGCSAPPKKIKKENTVESPTSIAPSATDPIKKISANEQYQKKISEIKFELNKALIKKDTIQKELKSLNIDRNISTDNGDINNTTYDTQVAKHKHQLNKLLTKYTKNHPEVKALEKTIQRLEARRIDEIKSKLKSPEAIAHISEKNRIQQELRSKLVSLNHKIGTLSFSLLENQQHYNDYQKLNYVSGIKGLRFIHPGGLHSSSQLTATRNNIAKENEPWASAYKALILQVQKGLNKPPQAVVDFNVPGRYQDAKGHKKAMKKLSQDAWIAYFSAIAYQLSTGKNRIQYAEKAIQTLNAWALINKQTSNFDGDLAMNTAGTGLIFAAELMTDYQGWTKEQRTDFKKWLNNVFIPSCQKISDKPNNWGDWGALGCIAAYYFLDDANAVNLVINSLIRKIDASIAADGSMILENERGKYGIWYTYFALAPLTAASQIALNARNIDLFQFKGMDGAGIEEALDYLLRYCIEPKKWPHYRRTDLAIPKPNRWPGNLFEAMYGIYGKEEYETWLNGSSPNIYFGHHYAWAVPKLLRTLPPYNTAHQ